MSGPRKDAAWPPGLVSGGWRGLALALLFACGWTGLGARTVAPQPPEATFLVLVSYNAWRPTVETYLKGLAGAMAQGGVSSRQFAVEYLDSDRLDTPGKRELMKQLLLEKYGARKLAFIVVIQQPAADFLQDQLADLAPGVPAFFVQARAREGDPRPRVFEAPRLDFIGTLDIGLDLFPRTKRVLLVTGSGPDDLRLLAMAKSELSPRSGRVAFQDTAGESYEQVMDEIRRQPPGTLIMPLYFNQDGKGVFYLGTEVALDIRSAANAPMLGYFEDVQPLGVCGSMTSLQAMGTRSGQTMLDILAGRRAIGASEPAIKAPARLIADWPQMQAWHVDEGRLPPGTLILNKPPTIWSQYRAWVIGALAFLTIETLLILMLLAQRYRNRIMEHSLQASEERFRYLIERSPVSIAITRKGRLVYVNPAMAAIWGFPGPESLVGTGLAEIVAPEDRERIQTRNAAREKGTDPPPTTEFMAQRRNGEIFPVYATVIRVDLSDGMATLAFMLDLTELKQAEAMRMAMEAKLQQSQKLEAIGQLASGVAHDINNMISVAMGHCELLRMQLAAVSGKAHTHLQAIERASERSKGIVAQLLTFSRKQAIEPRVLDLNARIRETLENLGPMLGETVELSFQPEDGLPKVWMDPIQVDQILLNLAVNARDAMPKGGTIRVETALRERLPSSVRENGEGQAGPWVELAVRDEGVGMTREVLDRIFEPFFTTKGEGKGTGLGLATVFGIVNQSGGAIGVESAPGLGTAFRILLPIARSEKREDAAVSVAIAAPMRLGWTLLVVEDEPMLRTVLSSMVEQMGCKAILAEGPFEALELCANAELALDLVLTDLVLPGMAGRELISQVRHIRPRIPILLMSGYAEEVLDAEGTLEAGQDFIEKPFTGEDLRKKVELLMKRS